MLPAKTVFNLTDLQMNIALENIIFLDIETVPFAPDYSGIDERMQGLWEKKSAYFREENNDPGSVWQRAGIYAEFGKIVCISVGHMVPEESGFHCRTKSYAGDDETTILKDFSAMITNFSRGREVQLCAHNGKEFDFPFIARRMLINGLALPSILDLAGKKPWEVNLLDTMELWKFGDYKHYTSLDLLAAVFDIPTPKDDIDGSMVAEVYWKDHDVERIAEYCEKDVQTVASLYLRMKGLKA